MDERERRKAVAAAVHLREQAAVAEAAAERAANKVARSREAVAAAEDAHGEAMAEAEQLRAAADEALALVDGQAAEVEPDEVAVADAGTARIGAEARV